MQSPIREYTLSMFLEKHSPLTPFFSNTIIKMSETGIKDVISKKHHIKKPNCASVQETGNSLGMEKFAPLFALYIIGCIVSLLLLMIEIIFNKSRPVLQYPSSSSIEFAKKEPEKNKPGINNTENILQLHKIRLSLESSDASKEVLNAVSILEKFFVEKKLKKPKLSQKYYTRSSARADSIGAQFQ